MVNVIWEIARKELLSYFTGKTAMLRNLIMLAIFCVVPITQIGSALRAGGYSSEVLSQSLEFYLMFSSFYALVMASTIAVMAFPYEKEQKTIEYLFTLPLKDWEILAGKALAAILAGIAGLAFVMAVILGYVLVLNGHLIQWVTPFPTMSLLLTILVIAPMIVVLSVLIIVAVSGFISNARMTYLPMYVIAGIVVGLSFARSGLGEYAMLANGIIIALLAAAIAVTFVVSVKTFNRERIAGN
ncbi:ABC transporter permease [Methanocella sp. MCL-LM]|uniref:ABC transporter permease n=1 Tax=Methanocella sp. MCL-LM TaxID=3412035 RepID=UPI003C75BBE8